jgi:predicted HTH domain antitoxin
MGVVGVPGQRLEWLQEDRMKIEIPKDILAAAGLTEKDCVIEFAVHLYASRRITHAQALRLSGLDRSAFEAELARRDMSLYNVEDLNADVKTLKELGRL